MTREQVEAMLAKLQQYAYHRDWDDGNFIYPADPGETGEYFKIADVREMLEGLIPISAHAVIDQTAKDGGTVWVTLPSDATEVHFMRSGGGLPTIEGKVKVGK